MECPQVHSFRLYSHVRARCCCVCWWLDGKMHFKGPLPCFRFLCTTTEETRLVTIGFYLAWWNAGMECKNQGAFYCRGNHASTWLEFWQSKLASSVQLDAMVVCIFGGLGIIRLSGMHSSLTPILECAVKSAVWRSLWLEIQHNSLCGSYDQGYFDSLVGSYCIGVFVRLCGYFVTHLVVLWLCTA